MSDKELEVKEKKEVQAKGETTYSCKIYQPEADIFETENEIVLFADMPGISKEDIEITLEDDTLRLFGKVRPEAYEGLRPLYVEYHLGHFEREFHLGERVDQNNIQASMQDGVLGLRLKKAEKALPRKIEIH